MASAASLIISLIIPFSSSFKWVSIPILSYQTNCSYKRFSFHKSTYRFFINPSRPIRRNPKTLIVKAAEYKFPDPIPKFVEAETEKFKNYLIEKLSKKDVFEDFVDEVVDFCTEVFEDLHEDTKAMEIKPEQVKKIKYEQAAGPV